MLKHTPFLLTAILLLAGAPVTRAQAPATAPAGSQAAESPQWLVDFSNLPREQREQYLQAFNKAKLAYQLGDWITCYSHLTDCELIFNANPHVWNLRVTCLLEQKFYDEAAAALKKALRALPHDPVTIMNQANLLMATGQYEESLAVINPCWIHRHSRPHRSSETH